ncbi:MAG TPA: helix-turn-helix domain-containing protein [Thermotogota bacterium]|nr:helix-turn-helix domain-containing protein [Thermotogota bacterium]HPJ89090.1 helix-turn-helix domain-containing protein [Thermotogota bacterium]HPR96117.1 helix-turn-helix domain-containing protein [Thermotogota bacterium]
MIKNYMTVDEISEKLKMHPKTIQRYIRDGRIKARKIGKSWYISYEDYLRFTGEEDRREKVIPVPKKVSVSTVIDILVNDIDESMRIANTLSAVMNNKDPKYGSSTMTSQYIQPESKIRIMLWGTIEFIQDMLDSISMLTQP